MNITDAIRIAAAHGATIGRYKPGIYYVTYAKGSQINEQTIRAKHVREVVRWIEENLK